MSGAPSVLPLPFGDASPLWKRPETCVCVGFATGLWHAEPSLPYVFGFYRRDRQCNGLFLLQIISRPLPIPHSQPKLWMHAWWYTCSSCDAESNCWGLVFTAQGARPSGGIADLDKCEQRCIKLFASLYLIHEVVSCSILPRWRSVRGAGPRCRGHCAKCMRSCNWMGHAWLRHGEILTFQA